ncbi:MAG: hypothetical protein ACXVKK_04065 [Flavisolibacter sp.]
MEILSDIPEEAVRRYASEHHIDLDIVEREAVQIYIRLRIVAEQLYKALDAYLTNQGGYFYTEEELDPASPSYRGKSKSYYYAPDMKVQHRGYEAALYLMEAVKASLSFGMNTDRWGMGTDQQKKEHKLEHIQQCIRRFSRILYTPAGKRALREDEEGGRG